MKEYTIIYKDGNSEVAMFPNKQSIIDKKFGGNSDAFEKEVKMLQWTTLSMRYVEDIKSGKINAVISTADANPYGWRGRV
ncbi:hypothetical protein [Mangrovivirga cuniculi]|nr:hypothetical protein [Mangrovivirga cuniculi]